MLYLESSCSENADNNVNMLRIQAVLPTRNLYSLILDRHIQHTIPAVSGALKHSCIVVGDILLNFHALLNKGVAICALNI